MFTSVFDRIPFCVCSHIPSVFCLLSHARTLSYTHMYTHIYGRFCLMCQTLTPMFYLLQLDWRLAKYILLYFLPLLGVSKCSNIAARHPAGTQALNIGWKVTCTGNLIMALCFRGQMSNKGWIWMGLWESEFLVLLPAFSVIIPAIVVSNLVI
jgi:hypothetical protein